RRRFDDAPRAPSAPRVAGADAGLRVLLDLPLRRRPVPHGRSARAEVLRTPVRARRTARPCREAVRRRPGGAPQRARRRFRDPPAGRVARRVRGRRRMRRAGRDPGGSGAELRRAGRHRGVGRRAYRPLARGARPVIAAQAEPHDLRLLLRVGESVVVAAADAPRKVLLADAEDASFSPDGTLVAFARDGDIWLANSDGSGQRRLTSTPNVEEWGPSWLRDGSAIVYTASVDDRRQIRIVRLPTAPSERIAPSNAEDYGSTVSNGGRLAFVSTRNGTPQVFVAQSDGEVPMPFDTATPTLTFTDPHDLAWSPDGTKLAYDATLADGTSAI